MAQSQTLGEKIRALRQKLKMTQQELAGDDFTKSFISQVEKNQARPSLKSLQIIASRLNKPVSYFLNETEENPPPVSSQIQKYLALGRKLREEKQYQAAIDYLNEALADTPRNNFSLRGTILTEIASCYSNQNNLLKAINVYQEAVNEFSAGEDHENLARTLNTMATLSQKRGRNQEGISLLRQALSALEKVKGTADALLEARVLTNLGILLATEEQFEEGLNYLQQAVDVCQQTGNYFKYGAICHTLSYIYGTTGETEKAIRYAHRAHKFYEAIDNKKEAARALCNLGALYRIKNQPDRARKLLEDALRLGRKHEDPVTISNAEEELALLARETGDKEQAMERLGHALAAEQAPRRKVRLLITLAGWERESELWNDARNHLRQAEKICAKQGFGGNLLADLYAEMGEVYQQKDPQKAQEFFRKSLEIFRKNN